ncbi:MAG: right-handed parallel beta-helix repeat-containing protein, partial [Desulfobulbaceae bacterium]|nr:right-handed parallel beta-helix repeat-containing protein [Desulfobulbaceae bacterium]
LDTLREKKFGWDITSYLSPYTGHFIRLQLFRDATQVSYHGLKILIGPAHATTTIYVDDDNTSGIEDGSLLNPFNTIQEALAFAGPGDTVYVFQGNYVENIVLLKTIFLVGEGPDVTIIDGSGAGLPAVQCINMAEGKVEGFSIQNGTGAGIRCEHSTVLVERNIIMNTGSGYGVQVREGSSLTIENNIICGNDLNGIEFEGASVIIGNNTIAFSGADGISCSSGDGVVIKNNIVSNNENYGISCGQSPEPQIFYNDIWNNMFGDYSGCSAGTGDISALPLFKDSVSHDYHLKAGSPCIDAGTSDDAPEFDFDGTGRYDDPNSDPNTGSGTYTFYDIGAFEYFPFCDGDFDGNGDVDVSDLATFAADFGRTDCGSSPPCEGNFDKDSDVDGSDLAIFAADFGRTDCPVCP